MNRTSSMKSEFQSFHFISSQPFKDKVSWDLIQLFFKSFHYRLGTFKPTFSPDGFTSSQFIEWYNEGFGAGDIAKISGEVVIISDCDLKIAKICGKISTDGYCEASFSVPVSDLEALPIREQDQYHHQLSLHGLEFNRKHFTVTEKFIPKINDRVYFYNSCMSGIGVIRSILPGSNQVELYCYYIYTTKQIGYSMHESGIVNFHDFHYEPMSIIAQRRLNTELNKHGKVWYDKLHRIEPLEVKVEVGEKYWYINDKMKIIQEFEKGTPTSHFRYMAGNYFSKYEDAIEYLGRISDLLRDRLAK